MVKRSRLIGRRPFLIHRKDRCQCGLLLSLEHRLHHHQLLMWSYPIVIVPSLLFQLFTREAICSIQQNRRTMIVLPVYYWVHYYAGWEVGLDLQWAVLSFYLQIIPQSSPPIYQATCQWIQDLPDLCRRTGVWKSQAGIDCNFLRYSQLFLAYRPWASILLYLNGEGSTSSDEISDGFRDFILKTIQHSCCANYIEISLEFTDYSFFLLLIILWNWQLSTLIVRILLFGYESHCDEQGPQPYSWKDIELTIEIECLILGQSGLDDIISPLRIEEDLLIMPDYHRHPLSIRTKGKTLKEFKALCLAIDI